MSNPPKRLRVFITQDGNIEVPDTENWGNILRTTEEWDRRWPALGPHTEHFYILEEKEKPMAQKEMTEQDAWIAMAKGECVKSCGFPHRINGNSLEYWDRVEWCPTSELSDGPYSIVPDPSKPEVKVDEYEADRQRIISTVSNEDNLPEYQARKLIEFIERNFQRKEAKQ